MVGSRRGARVIVMQAVFSLGEDLLGDLVSRFSELRTLPELDGVKHYDRELVDLLVAGIRDRREEFIDQIEQLLEVPWESVGRIEQTVILLAVVELRCSPSTPKAVVINEWLEIAKQYGADGGYKLVNVILDHF